MVKYFLAGIGGALMPLAFAPTNWWWAAFIALMLLWYVWRDATPMQAFWQGLVYGVACYAIGLSWFINTVRAYFGVGFLIAAAVSLFFDFVLALFIALPGYIIKKIHLHYSARSLLLVMPSCYVLFEYLRSWIFTGAPIYIIGLTQINSPLKNYAPIVGMYGISWLLLICVSLCWLLVESKRDHAIKRKPIYLAFAVILTLGVILSYVSWVKPQNEKFTVSVFQTNINALQKRVLTHDLHRITYAPLLNQAIGSDLLIWPEFSIPWAKDVVPGIYNWLNDIGKQHKFTILVSGPVSAPAHKNMYYSLVSALGTANGTYYKQHLLPFAEFPPYPELGQKIYQKFNRKPAYLVGPMDSAGLELKFTHLAPTVCYELLYAESVRKSVRQSMASAIVNLSEEGWFSTSNVKWQNLDAARMRALETGRYVLRSVNHGISAIINQRGELVAAGEPGITKLVKATVENMQGFTPWMLLGARGLIVLLFTCLLFGSWHSLELSQVLFRRNKWIPFLR